MKNLKTFEDYSDLDKQDKEKAKRNQISNFPHSAKEDAKKKEEREEKSRKEDPDGMYPRDDERYDSNDSSYQGGWQDGMGEPSWNESYIASDDDLDISINSKNGKLLYDFWRSNYDKDYIGLAYWLEDNDFEIFKDGNWKGFDGILYNFWSQNPDAEQGGLNSEFIEWLDNNNYEIIKK